LSAFVFYAQERPESCVPACLRMVLVAYGVDRSETELYICCQTDIDGTLPSAAAHCAQALGIEAIATRSIDLDGLLVHLKITSASLIAFINLSPLLGVNVIHAVIVETIDIEAGQVQVIDPTYPPTGRRRWTLGMFTIGWQLARRQVILMAPL